MVCPNFKKGLKMIYRPLWVKWAWAIDLNISISAMRLILYVDLIVRRYVCYVTFNRWGILAIDVWGQEAGRTFLHQKFEM